MSQHQPIDIPDYFPGDLPKFHIGQVVEHKRYGYRGVIVDFDMACQAEDSWYEANQTQPGKDQPWYHVLVHRSNGNTYAAEESLESLFVVGAHNACRFKDVGGSAMRTGETFRVGGGHRNGEGF